MNLEILENGTVKINGEFATYDSLVENLNNIGEYETEDCGTLDLFEVDGGYVEYLGESTFIHGQNANFTDLSFDEIMEHYNVK